MPLYLKHITLGSIGVPALPEPKLHEHSWLVFAPCERADYRDCLLFSQIGALRSTSDQKSAILALKKLIQVAALGQPFTVHYDSKQCHELHEFTYKGKVRVVWRIRQGDIRLPFYYGQGKLIFLAGALSKRKDKLSKNEKSSLEQEVKRYIDAETNGELLPEPIRIRTLRHQGGDNEYY